MVSGPTLEQLGVRRKVTCPRTVSATTLVSFCLCRHITRRESHSSLPLLTCAQRAYSRPLPRETNVIYVYSFGSSTVHLPVACAHATCDLCATIYTLSRSLAVVSRRAPPRRRCSDTHSSGTPLDTAAPIDTHCTPPSTACDALSAMPRAHAYGGGLQSPRDATSLNDSA